MKIQVLILGTMYCGARTSANIFSFDSDVPVNNSKEVVVFSQTKNWKKDIEDFHSLFWQSSDVIFSECFIAYTNYRKH